MESQKNQCCIHAFMKVWIDKFRVKGKTWYWYTPKTNLRNFLCCWTMDKWKYASLRSIDKPVKPKLFLLAEILFECCPSTRSSTFLFRVFVLFIDLLASLLSIKHTISPHLLSGSLTSWQPDLPVQCNAFIQFEITRNTMLHSCIQVWIWQTFYLKRLTLHSKYTYHQFISPCESNP